MIKAIGIDFDGVIHDYRYGWEGVDFISGEPVKGIKEVIDELRKEYLVYVISSRCIRASGKLAVEDWLEKYGIKVDMVSGNKLPAMIYIDDRAICFDGKAESLLEKVKSFKSYLE